VGMVSCTACSQCLPAGRRGINFHDAVASSVPPSQGRERQAIQGPNQPAATSTSCRAWHGPAVLVLSIGAAAPYRTQNCGEVGEDDIKMVLSADGTPLGEAFIHVKGARAKVRLALAKDRSVMPVSQPGNALLCLTVVASE